MKISKLSVLTTLVFTLAIAASAQAAKPLTCMSDVDGNGGFKSLVIVLKGDQAIVTGHASGGIAQFVTSFGPYTATRSSEGDTAKYTWGGAQPGSVTILNDIASTDYGFWANETYDCK